MSSKEATISVAIIVEEIANMFEENKENKIAVPDGITRQENRMDDKIQSNESAAITQIMTDPEYLIIKEGLDNNGDDPEIVKELMRELLAKQKTKHYLQGDEAHRMLSFMDDRLSAIESRTERMEAMLHELIGRNTYSEVSR